MIEAVAQVEGMKDHLPLECPRADVGIVYHPDSQELFGFNDETVRYNADLCGVYRTLWSNGIAADIVTPSMDWSGYRLLFLPNVALLDEQAQERIKQTLTESRQTRLVAEGSFGLYTAGGQSSYGPPEGLVECLGVRVADFSAVTQYDINQGRNQLETPYGTVDIATPCGYAVLEPQGDSRAIARLGQETLGVCSADGRFIWYGLTLSAGFGDVGNPTVVLGLAAEAGVEAPVGVTGDRVVPVVRRSRLGGWLVFIFNLERRTAQVNIHPRWQTQQAEDLLAGQKIAVRDGGFDLRIDPWGVAVMHCIERF